MSKYYLVPVTTKMIKIKDSDRSLLEVLEMVDTELYERELRRIDITYENSMCKYFQETGYINEFNNNTRMLYKTRGIPEKLILVNDEKGLYEFFTGKKIECRIDSYLEPFRISVQEAKKVINSRYQYGYNVSKFMKKASKRKKVFFKRKNSVKPSK